MKNAQALIMILFSFIGISQSLASTPQTTKIAIVHSYHQGFEWTDTVEKGFLTKLSRTNPLKVVARFYLDSKREPQNILSKSKSVEGALTNLDFDLLLITDDDAMKMIGAKYLNSKKYLVFAGVNRSLSHFGIPGLTASDINRTLPSNAAGVLEYYPITPLLDLIQKVNPKAKRLNVFFDESETSLAVLSRFVTEMQEPAATKFGFQIARKIVSNDQGKWEKALLQSNPQTDVNLIFPFSNVRDPKNKSKALSPNEFAEWITLKSKTMEFATASLTMKFPFFATVGIRGLEHGEDAAEAAKKLLDGTSDHRVSIGKYARLNINPERAKSLQIKVPFEIMAYSYSLQQQERKQ